jgi:type I restriction enzyme S subunit
MSDELPMGWENVASGNLFEFVTSGSRGWAKHYSDHGATFLRVGNLDRGTLDIDLSQVQHVSPPEGAEGRRTQVQENDLLISITADIGMVAVASSHLGEAYVNQHVALARPKPGISPRFLGWFLASPIGQELVGAKNRGATKVGLGLDDIGSVQVPFAPANEQRRIVAKVDACMERSGRAREALDAIPALLERYRQSVLSAAFRGDLTADWRAQHPDTEPASELLKRIRAERRRRWEEAELAKMQAKGKPPKGDAWKERYEEPQDVKVDGLIELPIGWTWTSVDMVCSVVQYGSSAKTNEDARGVPVLRMGNIVNGELDLGDLKFLPPEHDEFPSLLLYPGDILFNRTNSPELVGKCAVFKGTPERCSFASYLIRLTAFGILPELLSGYINSPFGRAWVGTVVSQQVGQANVNGTKLRALAIPLPPTEEQAVILNRIETAIDAVKSVGRLGGEAKSRLGTLNQTILAKAFRGELVPQDPNDEPAAVLLERIRAERAGNGSIKPRRGRRKKEG